MLLRKSCSVFCCLFAIVNAAQVRTLIGTGAAGAEGEQIANPYGLVIGPDRALYFCEIDNHRVSRFDLNTRTRTTVVDNQGQPYEVRFDRAGNLFFVDMPRQVVRRQDAKTKDVTTIAGTGKPGFSGDGGPAIEAQFKQPHSIAFDRTGKLLVCDIGNNRIRGIDLASGIIDTYAAAPELKGPRAISTDKAGNLYVVLREGNAVYRIDAGSKKITHVAGTGEKGYSGDGGPALEAKFNGPKAISCAPDGSIYIADTENHAIRRIDTHGTITTVLGTGQRGDGPDGDPLNCKLSRPHGVFAAPGGIVYVADSESHRIRVLTGK